MANTGTIRRRRPVIIVLAAAAVLAAAVAGFGFYFKSFMAELYEPVPVPPPGGSRQTVLCLGDSITHGNVSADYVDLLDHAFRGESVRFVNGGINGNMVHDVAARLDGLLAEVGRPDVVTLLIGTNDANATLDAKVAQRALDHPDVGRVPDAVFYRASLENLIGRIAADTGAEIILISIPTIGEKPGSPEWKRSLEFAAVCRETALAAGVGYVPFGEELSARVIAYPPDPEAPPDHTDWYGGMVKALISRHFFDRDYRSIGDRHGYHFHSDQLHLNEDGAGLLVELLVPEIELALGG